MPFNKILVRMVKKKTGIARRFGMHIPKLAICGFAPQREAGTCEASFHKNR